MKKILSFLIGILMILPLAGCKIKNTFFYEEKKEEDTSQESPETENAGPVWLNQSYVGVNVSSVTPMANEESEEFLELKMIGLKLIDNNRGYLIVKGAVYYGDYSVSESNENNIVLDGKAYIYDGDEWRDDEKEFSIIVSNDTITIEDVSENKEELRVLESETVTLNKVDDYNVEKGLYFNLGFYSEGLYAKFDEVTPESEEAPYIIITDNGAAGGDTNYNFYPADVLSIGNAFIMQTYQNYRKEVISDPSLFFVEKKADHEADFIAEFGDLDDVLYTFMGETAKIYTTREENLSWEISSDITFNASKIVLEDLLNESNSTENVSIELKLNKDGTVSLNVTGNEKYNVSTNGKWHQLYYGLFVELEDSTFFGGGFAIGSWPKEQNYSETEFIEFALSQIDEIDENIRNRYWIFWGENSEIENQ